MQLFRQGFGNFDAVDQLGVIVGDDRGHDRIVSGLELTLTGNRIQIDGVAFFGELKTQY